MLHLWSMGPDMVVAASAEDAWEVWTETTGEAREDHETCGESWAQWPDDKPLTLTEVDEPGQPKETKTGREWSADQGRGFFASTEY